MARKEFLNTKAMIAIIALFMVIILAAAGIALHRDTFHASLGAGRLALGLLWYAKLTGNGIDDIDGIDLDAPETAETLATVKACVNRVLGV